MKRNKTLPWTLALLITTVLLCCPAWLIGQITNPYPCSDPDQLPDACGGERYEIRFQFTGTTADNWSVFTGAGFPDLGFSFADASVPVMRASSAGNSATGNQQIRIQADIDGSTVTADFDIRINTCSYDVTAAPCKWDIAFVMDRSGSMGWPAGTSPTPTRWDKVLDIFSASGTSHIQTMASAAGLGSDDRWGVFFFGGNSVDHTPATHQGNFGSAMSTSSWPTPAGNTPMGAGMQSALQNFFSDAGTAAGFGKGRAVILLTDGAQNRNPRVDVDAASPYEFEVLEDLGWDAGSAILGNGSGLGALPIGKERFIINDIKLYAVGIGNGIDAGTGTDLDHLSQEFVNSQNSTELTTFFNSTIPDIFRGASPRIVNILRDTIPEEDNAWGEQSFVLNKHVKNLTLQFVATDNHLFSSAHIQIRLFKDGNQVHAYPTVKNEKMILYDIDFPITTVLFDADAPPPTTPEGEWTIRYYDIKPVPCMTTVFVDDKAMNYAIDFKGNKSFVVGDDLPVRLSLNYRDTALLNATVSAILVRPGEDLGDFVSNVNMPNDKGQNDPDLTQGQYKINYTTTNPDYFQALAAEEQRVIQLTDQGNGSYEGTFTGNNVSGGYRVITRITGTLPNGKLYEGWELEGVFFDFARPDDIELNEELIKGKPSMNSPSYTLVITPTNRLGLKLGPAQEGRIYAKLSNGTVGTIRDNLDGSYSIPLTVPEGSNPTVSVSVIDPAQPILEQCIRCFNNPWAFSVHAGGTVPFSALDSMYNSSIYAELDLRYQFNRNFAAELVGGYYGFQSDFSILGATAFGVYTYPNLFGPGWSGRGAIGLGVFKPKNQDATWGYGLRAGISKQLNAHWEGNLDLSYFNLSDVNYTFGAIGLGIHYIF